MFNNDKFYFGYSAQLVDHYNRNYDNDTIDFYPSGWESGFTSLLQLEYTFARSETANLSFTPQVAFSSAPKTRSTGLTISGSC